MNTKLYIFVRSCDLIGYTAYHDEILRLRLEPDDKLTLSSSFTMAINTTPYAMEECALVTNDLVQTYFACKIGLAVVTPSEWLGLAARAQNHDVA